MQIVGLPWWIWAYGVMSLLTVVAYARDKLAAVGGKPRISERTLHLMALLFGWPGALIAQQSLHHKTRKTAFMLTTLLIVLIHVAAWVWHWI